MKVIDSGVDVERNRCYILSFDGALGSNTTTLAILKRDSSEIHKHVCKRTPLIKKV